MFKLIFAILATIATGFLWFGLSRNVANYVLMIGGSVAALFWAAWFFEW